MRTARLVTTILALGAATACSSPTESGFLPVEGPPAALQVSFSAFGSGSHQATVRGDTLVLTRRDISTDYAAVEVRRVPDPAAWRAFWASVRDAGVGAWPSRCVDERIADGAGMTVQLVAGGRTIAVTASNLWPRGDGRCNGSTNLSPDVRRFLDAIAALSGRPFP